MRWLRLLLISMLVGCAAQPAVCPEPVVHQVPYEVKVPVYVYPSAPDELARPYKPTEYPAFVQAMDPAARYGLSELDWQRLQVILRTLHSRDESWRYWAKNLKGAANE